MVAEVSERIDIARLLSIDVSAELRKLAQAQLQGPWQVPAELVRRGIRAGASEIRIEIGRARVRCLDDGEGIELLHLQWVATLLDARQQSEQRHAALTALEAAGGLALLVMAGLDPKALTIETTVDGRRCRLDHARGRTPWVEVGDGFAGRTTEIVLECGAIDRGRAVDWLTKAGRFADVPVVIDGKPIRGGFDRVVTQAPLRAPLVGRVAIPLDGDGAHVWLLEHGLISGHLTIPDAPPFEAAVELGRASTELNAARLRDAIRPEIDRLVDQSAAAVVELHERMPTLSEAARARVARYVLQGLRRRIRVEELVTVPAFRAVDEQGPRLVDILTMGAAVQTDAAGKRILPALYPSQRADAFALGSELTLVVDEVERSRLTELLQIGFRPPDPRQAGHSTAAALRRALDGTGRAIQRAGAFLRHPFRHPPLPDTALTDDERRLVELLRGHLPADIADVRICGGAGPVRRTRDEPPQLLLPRGNVAVRRCVAAVSRDPAWSYPAALALLDGHAVLAKRST